MIEKTPNLDTRDVARRRLVKGAFVAPALLTLQSGGAYAATSIGTCLAKRNLSPSTQPVLDSDDVWFRYQLYGYVNNSDQSVHNSAYWIQGADLVAFKRDGMIPWLDSSSYQQFNIMTNTLVTPAVAAMPINPNASNFTWKQTNKWVSLRVDASGALKGAGASTGGSAVSDSCWNSFAMAPRA